MILEFKMKNVFSYKDEVVFSMLAPNNKVKNRYQDNYTSLNDFDILKTAVIVGENAGGKSNFIKGLQYFKDLFNETSNQTKATIDRIYNEDFFSLNNSDYVKKVNNENRFQDFSITLSSAQGLIFRYILKLSLFGIENESLEYTDKKSHVFKSVFECHSQYEEFNEKVIKKVILNIPQDSRINQLVVEQLSNGNYNGLIINSLSLLGVQYTSDFIKEIKSIMIQKNTFDMPVGVQYQLNQDALRPYFSIMKTDKFIDIFKMVDSSIVGLDIDEEQPLFNSLINRKHYDGTISKRQIAFDSTGVKNFLVMSILIYKVVYENAIIFNDEMDSTFNPILTSKVISYIHSFETKGQFVFTTHNIFNLTFQTFLKEQMFIVEKNKNTMESKLYSLAEFNDLRYDSNEKIYEYYMKGVLGGVGSGY